MTRPSFNQAALAAALAGVVSFAWSAEPAAPEAARGGATVRAGASRSSDAIAEILPKFDKVQEGIRSLKAEFLETTKNPLLLEPLVARGRFYLTKPGSVLWEYDSPEVMRFAIADHEYVGYFPERKRAERKDVRRWSEHLFRFFGLGQGSAELSKFYDLRVEEGSSDVKGTFLLVLDPKKRRVRKRVEEVRLWVDRETLLPRQVVYVGKDGYRRTIRFQSVQTNPDLSASLYRLEIPPDVTVSTGFTAFGTPGSER